VVRCNSGLVVSGIKLEHHHQHQSGHELPCVNYTDEEISTLLDFARPDTAPVTEWYNSAEMYMGAQPAQPSPSLPEAIGALFHHQDVAEELEHLGAGGHPVTNHVWELGSCPWNNMPGVCQMGDLSTDCRPLTSLADQMNDPCAIC
jgi:hypothetical protein